MPQDLNFPIHYTIICLYNYDMRGDEPMENKKEDIMEIILILLVAFIILALASLRWGVDSTDDINSCEWERRQH